MLSQTIANERLEEALLAGMLHAPGALRMVAETCVSADFFGEQHASMFEAMVEVGAGIDDVPDRQSVHARVAGRPELGDRFANLWVGHVRTLDSVERACITLKNLTAARKLANATLNVLSMLNSPDIIEDPEGVLDEAAKLVSEALLSREERSSATPAAYAVKGLVEDIVNRRPNPERRLRKTPLKSMQSILPGFKPGQLVILAGRPGEGKSSFGVQVADVEAEAGYRTLVYTGEMTEEELSERIIASRANVDSRRIEGRVLDNDEGARIINACFSLEKRPICLANFSGWSFSKLVRDAKREHRRDPLSLIVIDYLQLFRQPDRKQQREEEVSIMSRGLKQLAQELKLPVLALCQMNRGIDGRDNGEPRLSDLRESGSLEQDADIVVFVTSEPESTNGESVFWVKKQRGGETGRISARFVKKFSRFDDP